MSIYIQIIILLVVLACMVLVLLAIRQLAHYKSYEDSEETLKLKEEVREDGHILSRNNIFSTLVEAEPEKIDNDKWRNHISNSNDPLSRKE